MLEVWRGVLLFLAQTSPINLFKVQMHTKYLGCWAVLLIGVSTSHVSLVWPSILLQDRGNLIISHVSVEDVCLTLVENNLDYLDSQPL